MAPTGYVAAFGVGTTVVLLVLLRLAQRFVFTKEPPPKQVATSGAAWLFDRVGETVAVLLLSAAVVENCVVGHDPKRDAVVALAFGAAGVVLILGVGHLAARLQLSGRLRQELDRGNVAAGIAAGSHYVAIGLFASRAVAGNTLHGLGLSVAFFAIAQVTHMAFVALFRALTVYDDAEQIQGENVAAAISYAGVTIAVALVISRALEGEFEGWIVSLKGFGLLALWVLALYPVRQLLVQGLLLGKRPCLRGGAFDDAIVQDRNPGMAAMEAGTYVAAAIVIARLA